MYFRKQLHCLLVFISLSGLLYSQPKTTIAVLGLDAHSMSRADTDLLAGRLRSLLVNYGTFDVVERTKMVELLEEHGFQQAGCTANECMMEAGRILGVDKMIAGSAGKFGQVYTIELRMVDVKSSRIEAAATYDHQGEMEMLLYSGIGTALNKLLNAPENGGPAPVKMEGTLIVETDPPEAAVRMNNRLAGMTPLTIIEIPSGIYEIGLTAGEGYTPWSGNVQITSDDTVRLIHQFVPAYGHLSLQVEPDSAAVSIDGSEAAAGETRLQAGSHDLLVRAPFFYTARQTVQIATGETQPLRIALRFGGEELKRLQKKRNTCFKLSLGLLTLTAASALLAEHEYQRYTDAKTTRRAEDLRKKTELFDKTTTGLSVLSVGFSTAALINWGRIQHLKTKIGLN